MNVKIEKVTKVGNAITITVFYPGALNKPAFVFEKSLPNDLAKEIFELTSKEEMDKMRGAK